MEKTISAGGIVLNRHGQVLITCQHGTSWSLPKGHVDPGETLLDAAKREIAEETGVTDLTLVRYLGFYERYRIGKNGGEDHSELKRIEFFLFTTTQTELAPTDPENPEALWLDKADIADKLSHPKDKAFFEEQVSFI
ncbi:MAG: NUDIX hydrolase [Candidatus Margulisiibacteriota bacterium]